MGAGSMRVDLRDVEFPPGRTTLPLELGAGEIQVLVPDDLCVLTDAKVRMAPSTAATTSRAASTSTSSTGRVAPGTPHGARRRRPRPRASASATTSPRDGPGEWNVGDTTGYDRAARMRGDGMSARPGFDPASLVSGVIVIALGLVLLLDQADVIDMRFGLHAPRRARRGRRASCSPAG